MYKNLISIFILLLVSQAVVAKEVAVTELHNYADGLNIEGGIIPKEKLKHPQQIWANLAVVLDRPVITGETLDKITANNTYTLKEASILEYNEMKVNTAYAAILDYYLTSARSLCNKTEEQHVKITVHIHRNSSAKNHAKLLHKILAPKINAKELMPVPISQLAANNLAYYYYQPSHTFINFKRGVAGNDLDQENDVDVVISFGLVAGFNNHQDSGTLLIPDTFIPYKIKTNEVELANKYYVDNHLKNALPEILRHQSPQMFAHINTIVSENNEKAATQAKVLTSKDFHLATVLQADGYFYPQVEKNIPIAGDFSVLECASRKILELFD